MIVEVTDVVTVAGERYVVPVVNVRAVVAADADVVAMGVVVVHDEVVVPGYVRVYGRVDV